MRRKDKKERFPEKDIKGYPTLIGIDTVIEGTLQGQDNICIEGQFRGRIETESNVYINKQARVDADIVAKQVFVHGNVNGNITTTEELNIGSSGHVKGDVLAFNLVVESGGSLDGNCRMQKEADYSQQKIVSEHSGLWSRQDYQVLQAPELNEDDLNSLPETSETEYYQNSGSVTSILEESDTEAEQTQEDKNQ